MSVLRSHDFPRDRETTSLFCSYHKRCGRSHLIVSSIVGITTSSSLLSLSPAIGLTALDRCSGDSSRIGMNRAFSVATKFVLHGSTTTLRRNVLRPISSISSSSTVQRMVVTPSEQPPSPFAKYIPLAEKACEFLTASPDPFHAVKNCTTRLKEAGFVGLDSAEPMTGKLHAGGKYYYIVEHSTIVAFCVGKSFQQQPSTDGSPHTSFGFHLIGGHTDSPNIKLKPRTKRSSSGCTLLGVECYGGGLWYTWFDRDLSVSGRVLVQKKVDGDSPAGAVRTEQRLVNLVDPIARISTLAIHLETPDERTAFAVNKENHTSPIIATNENSIVSIQSSENQKAKEALEKETEQQLSGTGTNRSSKWRAAQEPLLLQAIADKLGVAPDEIVDFQLNLYDTQGASLGGITKEFIYSARLDNLATVFCALESIVDFTQDEAAFGSSADVSMIVAFDHEEVGSVSAQGAGSPVIASAVERIATALCGGTDGTKMSPDLYNACIRKSFILSIDQAHAIHPNYASKHEAQHAPQLNNGFVVKTNSNQQYATNGITGFTLRELCRIADVPVQEFLVRNDCRCGSTIGPTISAMTGIRTVDGGMPQLSMHSCREMMGIADLSHGVELFKAFFKHFRSLDESLCKEIE